MRVASENVRQYMMGIKYFTSKCLRDKIDQEKLLGNPNAYFDYCESVDNTVIQSMGDALFQNFPRTENCLLMGSYLVGWALYEKTIPGSFDIRVPTTWEQRSVERSVDILSSKLCRGCGARQVTTIVPV
jgi:hypothetical protein